MTVITRRLPSEDPAVGRAGVIGVLGGMGPAATADFYAKLVAMTPAARDQDHPKVVIWADPTVPDRTLALQGEGPDPSEWLARGAENLAAAGATLIAIPCNTAHAFLPGIATRIGLPVVHMIDEVATYLRDNEPALTRAGLLATIGTIGSGLYEDWLGRAGIETIVPDGESQAEVMAAIRSVKAGAVEDETRQNLRRAAQRLADRGAEVVIAGCTEIPLGLPAEASPVRLVDPTSVLAGAVLARVGVSGHAGVRSALV